MTSATLCKRMAVVWVVMSAVYLYLRRDFMPCVLASCLFSCAAMILGKLEAYEGATLDALKATAKALKEATEAKR